MKFLGSLFEFKNGRLTGLPTPVVNTEAANKQYVDDAVYFKNRGLLPSGNLNNVNLPGVYELSTANTYSNKPSNALGGHGILVVMSTFNFVSQVIYGYATKKEQNTWADIASNDIVSNIRYERFNYQGSWTAWF